MSKLGLFSLEKTELRGVMLISFNTENIIQVKNELLVTVNLLLGEVVDLNYSKRHLMQTCWKILMMRIIKYGAALPGRLGNLQCYGLVGAGELYRLILHS